MSEESRGRILLRRAKFVAAALAAGALSAEACDGLGRACLKISIDAGDAGGSDADAASSDGGDGGDGGE